MKTAIDFLTTPSNALFLLAVLALVALILKMRRVAVACLAISVAGFGLFGYTSASELLIAPLVSRFPPLDMETAPPPYGLVVLGGGINEVHAAYNGALMDLGDGGEAIPTAVLLAQRYPDAKIVLVDGAGSTPAPLRPADGMLRIMTEFGIEPDRIRVEAETFATRDRVASALEMIGEDREHDWWIITPAHRMPRVIGAFRAQGYDPIPYPIDFEWVPPFDPTYFYPLLGGLRLTDKGAHEWRGLLYYYLNGHIDTLFPGP